eukprot:s395_g33.t1
MLAQYIDMHGVEGIQCREDGSATLMIHESLADKFLASSGQNGMFTKIHSSDEGRKPTFLLWLPESTLLQVALDMLNQDTLGVVAKNSKIAPRLAIRFGDEGKLSAFAKSHGLTDSTKCGRWRIDGIAPAIGSAGIVGLLQSKGWHVSEFLYFGSHHAVFTADTCGPTTPLHYQFPGRSIQQVRFKALNSYAKKQQEDEAKKKRASAPKAAASQPSSHSRTAFLQNLAPKVSVIDLATPPSPRQRKAEDKRLPGTGTGETPPPKKERET